jgi:hypothetical protein
MCERCRQNNPLELKPNFNFFQALSNFGKHDASVYAEPLKERWDHHGCKNNQDLRVCGGCFVAQYCSKEHQRESW